MEEAMNKQYNQFNTSRYTPGVTKGVLTASQRFKYTYIIYLLINIVPKTECLTRIQHPERHMRELLCRLGFGKRKRPVLFSRCQCTFLSLVQAQEFWPTNRHDQMGRFPGTQNVSHVEEQIFALP